MNKTHQKILHAIFDNPVNGAMKWSDIESLLIAVGCRVVEGKGLICHFRESGG
ncbi:MAG: hypothetical protein RLZZ66_94 [Pseudomonadota bacterium]|jgi:hypothetical protein